MACLAYSSFKETPFTFDSQHRSACGRHYILVSIPLVAAVQYETEQEQSRADVSFCSSGAIHHRGRTEHRAVARSDLDGDQGRGDYCLPASNNTLANWAQGCSLTPLRAGNVRSAKDLKRSCFALALSKHEPLAWTFRCAYIVRMSWGCSRAAAYVDMLTLMRRCGSRFASQSTMSLCLLWQASPWKHAEVPGFQ